MASILGGGSAIPSSSGSCFIRTLHYDLSEWAALHAWPLLSLSYSGPFATMRQRHHSADKVHTAKAVVFPVVRTVVRTGL